MTAVRFDLARTDTICALATADAPAALAVVRMSGSAALAIRARVFRARRSGELPPFVATLGDIVDARGDVVDEALCTTFPAGRSYTGEAVVELSLHGGPTRVRATLTALVEAGCRIAEPGEFTLRAVLTGRLDLCAAEAVDDVIRAKSDVAARAALRNLRGGLATALAPVRVTLVSALAEIEARLDFPDEGLGDADARVMAAVLDDAGERLTKLLATAKHGKRLAGGARIVLYGAPNAGKSTLLNALAGNERALVHESPGTTRDVLEVERVFAGVPCVLVDVAGARDDPSMHPVEVMGVARARAERDRADVLVLCVDATTANGTTGFAPLVGDGERPDQHLVRCLTKSDLRATDAPVDGILALSAKTGAGIDLLERAIKDAMARDAVSADEALLSRERQEREVHEARTAIQEARAALANGAPHEVIASELRSAGRALDRLLGSSLDEDVLDLVFSRFCIGK